MNGVGRAVDRRRWRRIASCSAAASLGLCAACGPGSAPDGAPEAAAAAFPEFVHHAIDDFGSKMGQTALADVDNDGDLDWIAGQADHAGAGLWWWEYRGAGDWVRHEMGQGNSDVGGAAFDLNGDGWVDFLSGDRLLLNPGNPREAAFAEYPVGTIYSHDTEFADLDGDGRADVVANSDRSGLFWFEIPADPVAGVWTRHTVASVAEHPVHGGVSPQAVGDLDGDGDSDIATAGGWYENLAGDGTRWRRRTGLDLGEEHRYGVAVRTWVGDLDGDGDADVVQSEADNPDGRVAWFENDGGGAFTRHLIKDAGDGQDFHALAVADFDLDGDLDVFAGGGPMSENREARGYIWEKVAEEGRGEGPRGDWIEHLVTELPVHEVEAADVDGDGDIDIVGKPWSRGNRHFYLENRLRE